jgi:serine/threonine protein kinase
MSVEIGYVPNFSAQGYQIDRELGRNNTGGRVVYLAHTSDESEQQVVIKQFQFAKGAGWSEFKEIDREMRVLQDLQHAGIPRYLGSFPTDDGYCIVQEYIAAEPLSTPRSFDPDDIKQIAIALLEILAYLQSRLPIVIHRDLKPENVLVDSNLNVYLIDFGFARIGGGEVAMSSVAAGTFGFMAPEQIYNKGLTAATDLYGLGATLIALLTNTRSHRMDELIDENGKIDFRQLLPELSIRFLEWLDKMVAPKTKDRYANAKTALQALEPIFVVRYPTLELSQSSILFKATQIGEIVTQSIEIVNTTPDTKFKGSWSIAPHPHDATNLKRQSKSNWISFSPIELEHTDRAVCDISIDTSKLTAQSFGTRTVIFHSNGVPETNMLELEIETAPLPIQVKQLPYESLILLFIFACICGLTLENRGFWSGSIGGVFGGLCAAGLFVAVRTYSLVMTTRNRSIQTVIRDVWIGAMFGFCGGWISGNRHTGAIVGATLGGVSGLTLGGIEFCSQAVIGCISSTILAVITSALTGNSDTLIVGSAIGTIAGILTTIANINYLPLPDNAKHNQSFILLILCLAGVCGLNLGASIAGINFPLLTIDIFLIVVFGAVVYRPHQLAVKSVREYKQKERFLTRL